MLQDVLLPNVEMKCLIKFDMNAAKTNELLLRDQLIQLCSTNTIPHLSH